MQQNTFRKEMNLIEAQIDTQMQKISSLLQLIANSQRQTIISKQYQSNNHQQLNQTQNQTNYKSSSTSINYHFQPIQNNFHDQILLDGYCNHNQYTSSIQLTSPKQMIVATNTNWIDCFLDSHDAKVMLNYQNELVQLLSIQNGCFHCIDASSQCTIESSQVYKSHTLLIQFPKHLKALQLNSKVEQQNIIYQLIIQQKCRILFEFTKADQNLMRFLIIKDEDDEGYQIVWGSYSSQSIFQSLILQAGSYIILPLSHNVQNYKIYYQQPSNIAIQKDQYNSFKSFNLLKKLFEECKVSLGLKRSFSLASDSEQQTKKQYIRSCYMNYGIIVQIYCNIFEEECKFIDEGEAREDKQLLFTNIYTVPQLNNMLSPAQQLVKFYIINKKPANLFIPHKKVYLGNRAMQNLTFHHVFK